MILQELGDCVKAIAGYLEEDQSMWLGEEQVWENREIRG